MSDIHQTVRELSVELVALERKLHDAGMHKTARYLNKATSEIGFEACEIIQRTTAAEVRHER